MGGHNRNQCIPEREPDHDGWQALEAEFIVTPKKENPSWLPGVWIGLRKPKPLTAILVITFAAILGIVGITIATSCFIGCLAIVIVTCSGFTSVIVLNWDAKRKSSRDKSPFAPGCFPGSQGKARSTPKND